jgi:hypothetical protein
MRLRPGREVIEGEALVRDGLAQHRQTLGVLLAGVGTPSPAAPLRVAQVLPHSGRETGPFAHLIPFSLTE